MTSTVYDSIRWCADKLKNSIIKGDKFSFIHFITIAKHNIQIWETLGDERTQQQQNDQQLNLVIDIFNKKDEIYSLLPVYEKASFFERESNFLNQSWKDKLEKYQTSNIRPDEAFQMREQVNNALRYADERFNELTFLDENSRKKLSDANDYLESVKGDQLNEFVQFCFAKDAIDECIRIIKSPTEQLKQLLQREKKNGLTAAFYTLKSAREKAMMVPFFKEAQEMEPLQSIYQEMTQMISELEEGKFQEYVTEIDKEPFAKEIKDCLSRSSIDMNNLENCSMAINKNDDNRSLQDPEYISLTEEFNRKCEEVMKEKKEQAKAEDINIACNQLKSAISNNSPDAANKLYAKLMMNPNKGFIFNITEVPEVQKIVTEDFVNKYQTSITPDFEDQSNINQAFNSFTSEYNNIKDAIKRGNVVKFTRSIDNLKCIKEETEFLNHLNQQQQEKKEYVELNEILDNCDQIKEHVQYYPRFYLFINYFNEYQNSFREHVIQKNFSIQEGENFARFIRDLGPLYYDVYHELQFITDEEKEILSKKRSVFA